MSHHPSHPHALLFDEQDIQAIHRRLRRYDWAPAALEQVRCRLEPRRGELLAADADRPITFSRGGEVAGVLLDLALCSRLLDGWHREAALRILRQVRDMPSFLGHMVDAQSGYDHGLNGLMVSHAAFDLCLVLDFLPDLPLELRENLAQRVLVPMAEYLEQKIRRYGSNWQVQVNLALLSVGLVTNRPDFVQVVTQDPQRGLPYHMTHSARPDGLWFEQTLSYHLYTLYTLLRTRLVLARHGIDLGCDQALEKMVNCIWRVGLPGGQLPRISDCHGSTFYGSWVLELGYALYHDPHVGWILNHSDRRSVDALLFGEEIPQEQPPPVSSDILEDSGLALLRIGSQPDYWSGRGQGAAISFGPHGDWHGHPSKLGLEYWHHQDYLVRDREFGAGYALPIHRHWFATTAAHSTVVVDGQNQHFVRCHDRPELEPQHRGQCHARLLRQDVAACTVSADFAYPGCRCRRTLFLTAEYLLDLFECQSLDGQPRTFDWFCHTEGLVELDLPLARRSLEYFEHGYDYIRGLQAVDHEQDWQAWVQHCTYKDSEAFVSGPAMRLLMIGQPGTAIFRGWCPASERDRYSPVLVVRRRAVRTVFAALYVPNPGDLALRFEQRDDGTMVGRVCQAGGFEDLLIKQDQPRPVQVEDWTTQDLLAYRRRLAQTAG